MCLSSVCLLIHCTEPPSSSDDQAVDLPTDTLSELNFDQYVSVVIANEDVRMKLYPPDIEHGLYRGTRFDWSGVIGSVQYKGHEYFDYWKDTHDPYVHEDLPGPVEGYITPGLGYEEAAPGEGFIRIGVGILEKGEEESYQWRGTYPVLDHGQWTVNKGSDWITFVHELKSDIGYAYMYEKTIRLKRDGFVIEHTLENIGEKAIETDQFNHNFFVIDGEKSGPAFLVRFPYSISTEDDLKGLLSIQDRELSFVKEVIDTSVFVELKGFGEEVEAHEVMVKNQHSNAAVTFKVDKPLSRMAFWACETTLCPENFIQLSVEPGKEETWTSDYTFTAE